MAELADDSVALAHATSAVKNAPQNADFHATLGSALFRTDEFEAAELELNTATELRGRERAFDLTFLALTQFEQDQKSLAKDTLARAKKQLDASEPGNMRLRRLYQTAAFTILGDAAESSQANE